MNGEGIEIYPTDRPYQVLTVNRLPGAQEKTPHWFCVVRGDLKTPQLVVQWREQQTEACRLDTAIGANFKELTYGG